MATLDLTAEPLEIIVNTGATWGWTITWQNSDGTPIDNSGYTFTWTVFTASGGTLITASTGSGITNGGENGQIVFEIPPTSTAVSAATYQWTLRGVSGDDVYFPAVGTLVVEK
jgi:hypothetical protein